MISYEAPAKLNLSLHVMPPRTDGYHQLQSLVQTVTWLDTVSLSEGEGDDSLEVDGLEVPLEDNLVLRALEAVRATAPLAPQVVGLVKTIPLGAGLGGGSADAAATLAAGAEIAGIGGVADLAPGVGADVALFLTGGTLMMSGIGEKIEPLRPLSGLGFAIVVPKLSLSTADVYRRWDEMEGPTGEVVPSKLLPPQLREGMPVRNDLAPAAIDLEPGLGDLMSDLRASWGVAVSITGSGSGCFGLFPSLDEAEHAAESVSELGASARGVGLRDHGVARIDLQD